MTYWISTEIATTPNFKQRIKTLSHCIMLAEVCFVEIGVSFIYNKKLRDYNNWHGFLAIVSGILQYPVLRLNQTWKVLI